MEAILVDDDFGFNVRLGHRARHSESVESPQPVGWRLGPFDRPHLRNQMIRRFYRGFLESGNVCLFEDAKAIREEKEQEAQLEKLRKEFYAHVKKWYDDTAFKSSVSDIVLHPSYLRIIGMGPAVIPLVLDELPKQPAHWFPALEAITGANPIPDEDRGRIKRMVQHWLDWARAEQLIE